MGVLVKRSCEWIDGQYYCPTGWDNWGRWVFFGIIVAFGLIIFFLYACYNSRRRRRHGLRPLPGTAWMAPPQYQPQQYYHQDPYYQQQPPPQYSPNPQTHGYFGGQQTGIELQQPPNAYQQAGDNVYQPPPGPPPGSGAKK